VNVSDKLVIVFERSDRHPGIERYGSAIDRHVDELVGGRSKLDASGPGHRRRVKGFSAMIELHETGPIFILEPSDLRDQAPLLETIRQMARAWATRSTGGQPNVPEVSVRFGPVDAEGYPGTHYDFRRIKVTTEPLTVAERLDELIAFVMGGGPP
jgi:hypothetical protein